MTLLRKLKDGDAIQVGDRIKVETALGTQWEIVQRVTDKFAFVRYNERAEGKYRREYDGFWFAPLPRQKWSTNQYSAWRPVESHADIGSE